MAKLFEEEKRLHERILSEWYEAIELFTDRMDGIFSNKAKLYDKASPVWERVQWPGGFVHEITKKGNRVEQLFNGFDANDAMDSVNWSEINEELADIANYCRMLAAINAMMRRRQE